ncbi:hypothetical protein E4U57_001179 [Claviceps arundinis]|uniref:Apurinic-apyrimidinic endonuclease 1 n=1 Tax=Claviceps arundinis TaxID=1623583 RepID=A0A9P7MXP0_9HYPO|nr:hypothetical protein E4U57_001179 [Claviceps arundinis]KAG5975835.1 hypothetical protein E4U56_003169 [Claviceps arundinis]
MPRTSSRSKPVVNYNEGPAQNSTAKPSARKPGATAKVVVPTTLEATEKKFTRKRKAPVAEENTESDDAEDVPRAKKSKARASAKKLDEETMPLAERTAVSLLKKRMYIGAHVSAAKGVHNAITNAKQIGANSFALFLKSQRKWTNPPISDEAQLQFISNCKTHGYSASEHALPHGSYLVNLAQADETKAAQAYTSFVDDLQRCEALGIRLYNFHPGSTGGEPRAAAIGRIAAQLNKAHEATSPSSVVTVLENMAGAGNVIGSSWEDLRDIIALVEDKKRVGVCIDTCHAFAAGHDLRTPEAFEKTMRAFDEIVGMDYLRAFHLNDSKAPFNSNRDLHANIGTGFLGLRAFHSIVNHDPFCDMPMVLETPIDTKAPDGKSVEDKQIWADEIKLLESLIGMDAESEDFANLSAQLQLRGETERSRLQEQVDKKTAKETKKTTKGTRGVKKKD